MALVTSSRPNKTLKFFNSKLHKIRARPLDFLVQNIGPFTTPMYRFLNILKYLCLESRFSSLYHLSANSNIWKHCPIYRIGSAKIKEATWKIKDSIESTSKRCFYSSKRRESEHLKRLKNAKTWRNETESCFASLSNFTWALLHARGC